MATIPTFFCTAIPEPEVTDKGEITFAVLVTPLIRGEKDSENVPAPTELNEVPAPFDNWPNATGFPYKPKDKPDDKLTVGLALKSGKETTHSSGSLIVGSPGSDTDKRQELAARVWDQVLGNARVSLVPGVDAGSGATTVGDGKNFAEQPKDLNASAEAVRQRQTTIEGIGTHDLMQSVVYKLLQAHFENDDSAAPTPAKLEELGFALERLDRVGSAGTSSAAASTRSNGAGGSDSDRNAKKDEFHELVSSIGDDRALLRWLGLVFRVRTTLPGNYMTDGQQFTVEVTLKVPGVDESGSKLQRATPCRLRKRGFRGPDGKELADKRWICSVHCNQNAKSDHPDSLVDAGFIATWETDKSAQAGTGNAARNYRLDTVQADPIAVLRAALRDRDAREGQIKPGVNAQGPADKPHDRRPPVLIGHGVTIYRCRGAAFLDGVKKSLSSIPAGEDKLWSPEDLARGYVVDVRVFPNWPQAQQSDWFKLCQRDVTYTLPEWRGEKETALKAQDEACLGVTATEGATPLAGFLLGPLEYASKETRSGEFTAIASKRRLLSTQDCEALSYPKELWEKKPAINSFLLATPGGVVVVADVPTAEYLASGDLRGPISRRLAALTTSRASADPGSGMVGGGWVELKGTVASSGGYFLANHAEFDDEFIGGAAVLDAVLQKQSFGDSWPVLSKDHHLAALAVQRPRFELKAEDAVDNKPTVIHLPWDRQTTLSFFYFRLKDDQSFDNFLKFVTTNVKDNAEVPGILAQSRGEAMLAVQDQAALGIEALQLPVLLVFNRVVEGRQLEFNPYFKPTAPEADPIPVLLTVAEDAELRTATNPRVSVTDLPAGSLFEVHLKKVALQDPDFRIIRMREVGRQREARLVGIASAPNGNSVTLEIGGETLPYFAPDDATISVLDYPGTSPAQKPDAYVTGSWRELAYLLQRNDSCQVRLGIGASGNLDQVETLDILQRESNQFSFGWFMDLSTADEKRFSGREDVLAFKPLGRPSTRWLFVVDDTTTIVEGAPFAGGKWRTRQLPPLESDQAAATLTRVFFDGPASQTVPTRASLIELHHLFRGLAKGSIESVAGEELVLRMCPAKYSEVFEFHVPARVLPKEADRPWKNLPWKDGKQVGVQANSNGYLGEIIVNVTGRLEKKENKFDLVDVDGNRFPLEKPPDQSFDDGTREGTNFDLRCVFVNDQGLPSTVKFYAAILNSAPSAVRVQVKDWTPPAPDKDKTAQGGKDAKPRGLDFAVDSRVLANPQDYFARTQGRDRKIFFLPGLWKKLVPDVSPDGKTPTGLLQMLAESHLPIELDATPGVLIDETGAANASASSLSLRQWWSLHSLPPPINVESPDDKGQTTARWVYPKAESSKWVRGRVYSAVYPQGDSALWTVFQTTEENLGGLDGSNVAVQPSPVLGITGKSYTLAKVAADDVMPGRQEDLLPDQVIVDDSLVHWFGNSLARNENRRRAFEPLPDSTDSQPTNRRLFLDVAVPEQSLPPLRVGWKYQFRFRAVWITADPVDFRLVEPNNAVLDFHPFGSDYPLDRFQRVEAFYPPRVGWPHAGEPEAGAPDKDGWVAAPDVYCPEQADARDFLHKSGLLPPRVAEESSESGRLRIEKPAFAGTPTDLILRSDTAQRAIVPYKPEDGPLEATRFSFVPVLKLPENPKVALRPAAVAQREVERLGELEQWEATHPKHTLYWDVLWAYDEVERCDAWWTTLGAYLEEVHRRNKEHRRFSHKEEADYFKPASKATEGRFLHRLPDPATRGVFLSFVQETSPGIWKRVGVPLAAGLSPDVTTDQSELNRADFDFSERGWQGDPRDPKAKRVWPGCRELHLQFKPAARGEENSLMWEAKTGTIQVRVAPDADLQVEISTIPDPAALQEHAFQLFESSKNGAKFWEMTKEGHHPLIEPAARVRIRHATNQPRQAPQKIALEMVPRAPGDTDAKFHGRFEIDRPSTGALLVQAALEMDCVDDKSALQPRMPKGEFANVIAFSREIEQRPVFEQSAGKRFGRSSDSTRTLESNEFGLSELQTDEKSVSPFGPTEEQFSFTHAIGDTRHRRVYYRVLAVSRWESLFPEDLISRSSLTGTAPSLCQTNPLRGPFTVGEANALERQARSENRDEPWGWYRTHIPATKRPEKPVLSGGGDSAPRTAFAWEPYYETRATWGGGMGHWSFSRSRVPLCRVWLERPWFTSGADEKLAVLCLLETRIRKVEEPRILDLVTRWGLDAAGTFAPEDGKIAGAGLLTRDSFLSAEPGSPAEIEMPPDPPDGASRLKSGSSDRPARGESIGVPVRVAMALHTPRFHDREQRWFCDLYLRPTVYRPFLYLKLARYQPYAIPGCALSTHVLVHPVAVLPVRSLDMSLTFDGGRLRAEIIVTGLISLATNRAVVCRLQRLATDNVWPSEDLPPDFDPRQPHEMNPAVKAPGAIDLGSDGEFWQSLAFRTPDSALSFVHRLDLVDAAAGKFHGIVLIEPDHFRRSGDRLRFSVEEVEFVSLATPNTAQAETYDSGKLPAPAYFDQVELPPEA